jgi:hypothetical protein
MPGKNDQTKRMSYPITSFFSSERKGNEYQIVKLGVYDEKVTLNFYKGTSGGGSEGSNAYVSLDYETACHIKQMLDIIILHRVELFRNKAPYDDIYFTYNIMFNDKDGGGLRTAGSLTFKSAINPDEGRNIVHLQYSNGTSQFDIGLGNQYLSKSISQTDGLFDGIDKSDARLYALAHVFHNIIKCWPILMQNDKIASTLMYRINAISEKLGVSLDYSKNGKYPDKYRSSPAPQESSADPF